MIIKENKSTKNFNDLVFLIFQYGYDFVLRDKKSFKTSEERNTMKYSKVNY